MVIQREIYSNGSIPSQICQNSRKNLNLIGWGSSKKYFVDNKYVAIQCVPRKEEKLNMAKEEKERIEAQIQKLTEAGLKSQKDVLEKAIEFNEREPPMDMITSVPIPSLNSIKFHNIVRHSSASCDTQHIDLSETPIFTYFDNLKTSFVYIFALLDTSSVPSDLRNYLPILLESILELPIERNGKIIPYEEIVAELNNDTVSSSTSIGLGGGRGHFKCGNYSQTCVLNLQVEASKYEIGLRWLRELLYKTVFTTERLKVIAMKMNNTVAQAKRSGRSVVSYAMKGMCYSEDSNIVKNGVLQQKTLRKIMTNPSNFVLYLAGNLESLKDPVNPINECLPPELQKIEKQSRLTPCPDYKLLKSTCPVNGCIIGMGCLESSFFYQTTKSITDTVIQTCQGPMWKQIRGKGYSYGYTIMIKVNEGLLYLVYSKATNVIGAYKETKEIITKQLDKREWDGTLLESAKSSLIFEIIDEEKTIGNVVALSLASYFQDVDYTHNRTLMDLINKVTVEDLNRILQRQMKFSLDLKKLDLDLLVYPSLEDSFLNTL
ncbi:hypothetical protein NQ317_009051 [Molorchus minor]|uniref:Peptidase M16C associated domain-containing protein n=1 Tax=Molorchus minor TaxID=1323400 RepID=A0ABQ9J2A1_9CUCU|nr:hypothetical protein NQ317_009051 [Molorchus minor]